MPHTTDRSTTPSAKLRWLALVLAVLFVLHFAATVIYTVDDIPVDARIKHRVSDYMKPMFHQGWKLFAPDVPTCNPVVQYRILRNGDWDVYTDLLNHEQLPRHPKLNYMTNKLAAYLMNALRIECGDRPDLAAMNERALQSGTFSRCVQYAMNVHALSGASVADSIQIQLVLTHIPPFGGGAAPEHTTVELPAMPLLHERD